MNEVNNLHLALLNKAMQSGYPLKHNEAYQKLRAALSTHTAQAAKAPPSTLPALVEVGIAMGEELHRKIDSMMAAQAVQQKPVARVRFDSGEVHIVPLVRHVDGSPLKDGQTLFAPTQQAANEPTAEQVALLDPWMRPEAARELLRKVLAVLKPCQSPYCECEHGKCGRQGFYDARGASPLNQDTPRFNSDDPKDAPSQG